LIFSHAFDGPDLYGALSFFETMPSNPSWHICKGTRSGEVAFKYPQWEETNMKKLALILLAAASLVGTTGAASAQWYGGGYYGDRYYGDRYRQRYYDDDRYYRKRYYRGGEKDTIAAGSMSTGSIAAGSIAAGSITPGTATILIVHSTGLYKTAVASRIADAEPSPVGGF
jgi:hypothetical protein